MCFSDFGFQEHRPLFQTFAMVKRSPAEIFCFCKEGCQTKQQKILKLAACRNFCRQKREQKKWNMTLPAVYHGLTCFSSNTKSPLVSWQKSPLPRFLKRSISRRNRAEPGTAVQGMAVVASVKATCYTACLCSGFSFKCTGQPGYTRLHEIGP